MAIHKRIKTPEGYAQQAVLEWLQAIGILAFRMNTGSFKVDERFIRAGVEGMGDILAFPWFEGEDFARCLWIEIKAGKRKQTPEQKSFEQQVTQNGMHYIVARSIEDVERWLKEKGSKAA